MTNKEQYKMEEIKLYTKEMFLIAAEKCEVSMIDAKHIMKYIDEYVIPIVPPSDDEIDIELENTSYSLEYDTGFTMAVKWMIDKIINQII